MNLKAEVVYKNKQLNPVSRCVYPLEDYTAMLSLDLKRIITDVEDLIYVLNKNRPKEEWGDMELSAFGKIRSKILDKAGEVERLPLCIFDADADEGNVAGFWDMIK